MRHHPYHRRDSAARVEIGISAGQTDLTSYVRLV